MRCLFLCAGYATRLYPLTENFPKPLLEVKGKTILDWLISDLEETKLFEEYIIISNHKYFDSFKKWANNKAKITVLDDGTTSNENRLGAVKDIKFTLNQLKLNEDLFIFAGDNILDFSINEFVNYSLDKNASCVMRYFEPELQKIYKSANVAIDDNDLVLAMKEKPTSAVTNWCVPPFYFYKAHDLSRIQDALDSGIISDSPGGFACYVANNSKLFAMKMPGKRYDIGTLDQYKNICEMFERNN